MKYFDINEILKLDISNDIKKEIKDKFNKNVYYDDNGYCRMGILNGIDINRFSEINYIINDNLIPSWKSIAIL